MNGATALPLVNTVKPPKTSMAMRTGSNQNFLRTRKNFQILPTKDSIDSSLLGERHAQSKRSCCLQGQLCPPRVVTPDLAEFQAIMQGIAGESGVLAGTGHL